MLKILWAMGGWDRTAGIPGGGGEAVVGGVHLDEAATVPEAVRLAVMYTPVAARRHGPGVAVVVGEGGALVEEVTG